MLRSFKPQRITPTGFELAPGPAERRKAVFHVEGRGVPRRQFIGLDQRQIDEAAEAVLRAQTGKAS